MTSVADTWPNIGGQAYCFGRMTSHISIVLEQKTIVFQNIGGPSYYFFGSSRLLHYRFTLRPPNIPLTNLI